MKSRTKIIVGIAGLAGVIGLALIPPTLAHGGKQFAAAKYRVMDRHGPRLFDRFDADKDGSVTKAEIEKTQSDLMARFDTDQDGNLSLQEYEGVWMEFMRDRMVDMFQHLDRDGDAVVTSEELESPVRRIVDWVDRNDDGTITREELREMGPRGGHHHRGERYRRHD